MAALCEVYFGEGMLALYSVTRRACALVFVAGVSLPSVALCNATRFDQAIVFGWVENVALPAQKIQLQAKLDTGADFSSLGVRDLVRFTQDNAAWVRFTVEGVSGPPVVAELEVVRTAKIKRQGGGANERPVVKIDFCLGNIFDTVEVTLADRSNFAYPVLLGRNFLLERVLVSSSRTFTAEPKCEVAPLH